MARTAWMDRGTGQYPVAASTDNYLYYHEFGEDDGSTNPVSGISAHIESSQIDIGDGNQFSFITRIIPDLTFRSSADGSSATLTLKTRNAPVVIICKQSQRQLQNQLQFLLNNLLKMLELD